MQQLLMLSTLNAIRVAARILMVFWNTFQGTVCDDLIPCNSRNKLCLNSGVCVQQDGLVRCRCVEGYSGPQCQYYNPCSDGTHSPSHHQQKLVVPDDDRARHEPTSHCARPNQDLRLFSGIPRDPILRLTRPNHTTPNSKENRLHSCSTVASWKAIET